MRVKVGGTSFIYKGRALSPGEEVEMEDRIARQKINAGDVSEVGQKTSAPAAPSGPKRGEHAKKKVHDNAGNVIEVDASDPRPAIQ